MTLECFSNLTKNTELCHNKSYTYQVPSERVWKEFEDVKGLAETLTESKSVQEVPGEENKWDIILKKRGVTVLSRLERTENDETNLYLQFKGGNKSFGFLIGGFLPLPLPEKYARGGGTIHIKKGIDEKTRKEYTILACEASLLVPLGLGWLAKLWGGQNRVDEAGNNFFNKTLRKKLEEQIELIGQIEEKLEEMKLERTKNK